MEYREYDFSEPAINTRSSDGGAVVSRIVVVTKAFKLSTNPKYAYQPGERLMLAPSTLADIVEAGCGVYE
jgi:hypothetical protein